MNTTNIFEALTDYAFWSSGKETSGIFDFVIAVLDDSIGFAVLCVACVLLLSYLRERPPEFEKKRILISASVLFSGALLSRIIAHFQTKVLESPSLYKSFFIKDDVNHLPKTELLNTFNPNYINIDSAGSDDYLKAALTNFMYKLFDFNGFEYERMSLIGSVLTTAIGFVSICAGAFILMRLFRAKHIMPMAVCQIIGLLLRQITEKPYKNFINWIVYYPFNKGLKDFIKQVYYYIFKEDLNPKLPGYNGFAYGCFMVIMIILYVMVTKIRYESFWTKNINMVKHILSVIGLFVSYTFLIIIYNCIGYYMNENLQEIIAFSFELMINIFLAAVLLYVPKRTYDITRGELQGEFYEVKREEEVEQYSYSESRIRAERKYMHDLPAHFRELTSMAEKRGAEEISQYVEELDKKLVESKGEFSTGNVFLDNFLYDKLKNAQQYNIDILFSGVFPNQGVRRVDITTIFHNLIENAIDACKNVSGKREIIITSKIHEDRVYISISNPFEQKLQKKQGKYETSKKNKAFHGYGLSSVESTVKKSEYDGSFSTTQEGDLFIAEVNLKYKR
ncbi:MAG: GHKL domain-containing protein [Clostridia bacterium]|nr:GHKL domain-containing protein [Clostridia bacterium]